MITIHLHAHTHDYNTQGGVGLLIVSSIGRARYYLLIENTNFKLVCSNVHVRINDVLINIKRLAFN